MYETIFELADRPFLATPQANRYFAAVPIESARQTLIRGIERAEGPGLLIGPPGSGKSLICQLLAEQFADDFEVVMLSSTRLCTPRALLQNILFELGLPFRDLEEGELRLNLIDFLQRNDKCPNGILLLVDEANTLPLRLLEEIRMITNVVRGGIPRVRLVLAGGPQLEERFASPRLESLNQRIAARCYLQSMTREETAKYVKHQVRLVGGNADALFSSDALQAVYHATDGIPRLINQVCDHALMLAAAAGQRRLNALNIEESWADLQQLPAPSLSLDGRGQSSDPGASDIIEFGQLDDEASDFLDPTVGSDGHAENENAAAEDNATADTREDSDGEPGTIVMPVVDTLQAQWSDEDELISSCQAVDPFGAGFDEEEVVLDRYATLDSGCGDSLKRVAAIVAEVPGDDAECLDLPRGSMALVPAEEPGTELADNESTQPVTVSEAVSQSPEYVECETDDVLAASSDDVACESKAERLADEVLAGQDSDHQPTIHCMESAVEVLDRDVALEEIPDDDRDMIVIEEDAVTSESVPAAARTRVRRREYRHLFAKLRRN